MSIKTKSRKLISILLVTAMMLTFMPFFGTNNGALSVEAHAADETEAFANNDPEYFKESYFTYIVTDVFDINGTAVIVSCDASAVGEVIIPSVLSDLPVTAIGENAFEGCENITSITIPDSLMVIGTIEKQNVFSDCISLERIIVDENNQYYSGDENGVLFNKDKTKLLHYPMNNKATSYEIPDSVVTIGNEAFLGSKLENITIPYSVTTISDGAFSECYNLTSVYIPSSVTSIGYDNWHYVNQSKTDISKCTDIAENTVQFGVFRDCHNLEKIIVDDENAHYSSDETGVLFNKDKTELIRFPIAAEAEVYEIPDSVSDIGCSAFNSCNGIGKIKFGKNVKNIDTDSFGHCESIEFIEADAENMNFSSDEFGVLFNKDKSNLILYPKASETAKYVIPDSVTSISGWSFYMATNLYEIVIPDSVVEIGIVAFSNCGYSSESSNWENGLLYIGKHLVNADFYPSDGESSAVNEEILTIKDGTLTIAGGVFNTSDFTSEDDPNFVRVNFPSSLKSIGEKAFVGCSKLEEVYIPSDSELTYIHQTAFRNCVALKEISLPDSLKYIGDYSFTSCENLATVSIGSESELELIGAAAFWMCYKLEGIYIPSGVKTIGEQAFWECESLTEAKVGENSQLSSIEQMAFQSCVNLESFTVPANVTYIGDYAFENCGKLSSVTFEKDSRLENIGLAAFSECVSLTDIVIPTEVAVIGDCAFYGCSNIENLTFEEGSKLKNIGSEAFSNCISLTDIVIPEEVTVIGDRAFFKCYNIETLNIPENVSDIGTAAFACCSNLKKINVSEDNPYFLSDDAGVLYNKDKTRLIQYPSGRSEDSYIIPRGVEDMSYYAVSDTYNLHHLHIPSSLTVISDWEDTSYDNEIPAQGEGNPNNHIYYEGTLEEFNQIENSDIFDAVIHPNSYGQATGTPETPDLPEEPKELESIDGSESPVKVYPENGAYDGEVFVEVKEVNLNQAEVDELETEYARLSANTTGKAVKTFDIKVVRKNENGESVYADINQGKKVKVKIPAPEDYDANKTYIILHKLSDVQNENNKLINYIGKTTVETVNGKVYFVIDVEHFSNFTIMEVEKKTVSSISVSSLPSKTSYIYKTENIDLNGIALTVTYADGIKETVIDTSAMKVIGFDNSKAGTQTVTVEYEGATATFEVTVSYAWWQWIIRILLLGFLWY